MGVLKQNGTDKSRKRKRSADVSPENENEQGVDSSPKDVKKIKKEKRASLPGVDDSNSVKDDSGLQSKPKKRRSGANVKVENVKEEIVEPPEEKKLKQKKRLSSVKDAAGSLKKEEITPSKKVKKEKKSLTEKNDNVVKTKLQQKKGKGKKKESEPMEVEDNESESEEVETEKRDKTEKLVSSTLDYLHQWKKDVKSWTFSKYYQSCLINFVHDPTIINQEDFETCLKYLKRCRGTAKKRLKEKAKAIIDKKEIGPEKGMKIKAPKQDRDNERILFVKNLPFNKTRKDLIKRLKEIFTTAVDVRIPTKYVGFGFVEFSTASEVTTILAKKQGVKLDERVLFLDQDRKSAKSVFNQSLSPDFVDQERPKRAQQILAMLAHEITD